MAAETVSLKTAAFSVATVFFMEWAARALVAAMPVPPVLIVGVVRLLEGIVLLWTVFLLESGGLAAIGVRRDRLLDGLWKGCVWSAAFGLAAGGVFAAFLFFGLNLLEFMRAGLPGSFSGILLFFLIGSLVSPVAEEIFFRGVLYGFFRRWGAAAAVAASTLLFVAAHALSSRAPVTQAVGGILFAVAYEREKNLTVPVVIHVMGNLAIFTLALLVR